MKYKNVNVKLKGEWLYPTLLYNKFVYSYGKKIARRRVMQYKASVGRPIYIALLQFSLTLHFEIENIAFSQRCRIIYKEHGKLAFPRCIMVNGMP